jgi:hypothetical protein
MEGSGVKVGPVGPDKGMAFRIKPYGRKEFLFPQWTEKFTAEHRQKVDFMHHPIVEVHPQGVIGGLLKGGDLDDKV